ncbi:MAG: fprA [Firmicutes bacterium]|nr:fprA [Bacillota bacterium]
MNKIEIAKGVYNVGAVDWDMRDFHGFTTNRGVTYNSYLIVDEKVCLIDTVKAPFAAENIERISEIIDPTKIDYVITNHVEPDHSSGLPALMQKAPQAKVVVTANGKTEVLKHYQQEYDFMVVKEGDVLDLGKNKLHFVPLPMVHWPDSMVTYLDGEQILFSSDSFGQHICTSKRFDDENDLDKVMYEAAKYYANILMPLGKTVSKAVDKTAQMPLKMIATGHGIIWRSYIDKIVAKYKEWSSGQTKDKVVIAYDSMWGSTEKMARCILDGVAATGVAVKLYKMSDSDRSEVVMEMLDAGGILLGSPTLHNGMLATMGALLIYLKGLKPANKLAAAFGAYGWAGGAQKDMEELLKTAGVSLTEGVTLKWVPDKDEMDACFNFGKEFGQKVLERNQKP